MARSTSKPRRRRVRSELKNLSYEIFIGILSMLSIANIALMYLFFGDAALQQVLWVLNALMSLIFLGDFVYRICTAESAVGYFFRGFGWADLLASLPLPQLKVLRVFRLVRVIRLMRAVGPRAIWSTFLHDRANSALITLLLMGILVLQFGSLAVLAAEEDAPGANIVDASDALWYTIVTISTVGYGDQSPVTDIGRTIGAVIIIVGVGIFGTFTGYLANLFLGPQRSGPDGGEVDAAGPAPSDVAGAAAKGVAAGAVSGAVTAGAASAGAGPASAAPTDPPAAAPPAAAPPAADGADAAQLRSLLAKTERTLAEARRLLAEHSS